MQPVQRANVCEVSVCRAVCLSVSLCVPVYVCVCVVLLAVSVLPVLLVLGISCGSGKGSLPIDYERFHPMYDWWIHVCNTYIHTMYVCASFYLTYARINIVSFHLIYLWNEYTISYLGNLLRTPLEKLNIFTKSGQTLNHYERHDLTLNWTLYG